MARVRRLHAGSRAAPLVRLLSHPLDKSGSCNLDVAYLDPGDTWREEMRAMAVISTAGSTFCIGSLLNDTAIDQRMFFITANHCSINSSNAPSLVVYRNYQNSCCRTFGSSQSGAAGDGTLTQFHAAPSPASRTPTRT